MYFEQLDQLDNGLGVVDHVDRAGFDDDPIAAELVQGILLVGHREQAVRGIRLLGQIEQRRHFFSLLDTEELQVVYGSRYTGNEIIPSEIRALKLKAKGSGVVRKEKSFWDFFS